MNVLVRMMRFSGFEPVLLLLIVLVHAGMAMPSTDPAHLSVRPKWQGEELKMGAEQVREAMRGWGLSTLDTLGSIAYHWVAGLDYEGPSEYRQFYPSCFPPELMPEGYDLKDLPPDLFIRLVFWKDEDARYRGPTPQRLVDLPMFPGWTPAQWVRNRLHFTPGINPETGQPQQLRLSGRLHTPKFDYTILYMVGQHPPTVPGSFRGIHYCRFSSPWNSPLQKN
ncbi:MAG: hypothetical protein M1837_005015 [Sclerophora amabilis]|nr:MAG: hypothetical protein M1837_005015 [Sclerophora amabilis]